MLYHDPGSYLLLAAGTSQHRPERGRIETIKHATRLGRTLGLKKDTHFEPWGFNTTIHATEIDDDGMLIPRKLHRTLLDNFEEAYLLGQLHESNCAAQDAAAILGVSLA